MSYDPPYSTHAHNRELPQGYNAREEDTYQFQLLSRLSPTPSLGTRPVWNWSKLAYTFCWNNTLTCLYSSWIIHGSNMHTLLNSHRLSRSLRGLPRLNFWSGSAIRDVLVFCSWEILLVGLKELLFFWGLFHWGAVRHVMQPAVPVQREEHD